MPLEFPDNILKGRSRQPFNGGLFMDFSPVITGLVAAEAIGWAGFTYTAATDYPKAPLNEPFNMLYMYADMQVKKMTLGASTYDYTKAKLYAGFTEEAVRSGYPVAARVAGQVWIPIGETVAAGELVVPCTNNAGNGLAGDIAPMIDPAASDTPSTSHASYASMVVGRCLKGGAARTSATVFNMALIVLRGY